MILKESIVALIPARHGSKRIPAKNISDLGGIPLLVHSLRIARQLKGISGIFMSTDSDEVAETTIKENCVIVQRSKEASQYKSTNYDVIKDALPKITEHLMAVPDILILLQPTHPFRCPDEINKALKIMNENPDASSLISVTEIKEAAGRIKDGYWHGISSLSAQQRLNEEPIYQNTGNFYLFRIALTFARNELFGDRILAYPLSLPVIDINIDLPHELQLARLIQEQGFDLLGLEYNPVLD